MFIGEFNHSIDEKSRVSVPAKFREELAKGLVLTRGLDGCLWVYPIEKWAGIVESVAKLPVTQKNARSFSRFILSGAMDIKLDRAGRVLIPKYLAEYAGLKNKVVVIGMNDRLELWSEQSWNDFRTTMEENSDEVAETLAEVGM